MVKITISEAFLRSATVEEVAHVLVHDVWHWSCWTDASMHPTKRPVDVAAFWSMRNEWMVFGNILP